MITPKGKRIFAWVMAIMMALMFVAPALSLYTRALDDEYSDEEVQEDDFSDEKDKISDLNSKYKDLEAQKKALDAQLSKVKGEKEKQVAVKQQIGAQIENTSAQIDVLGERIDLLEKNIAQKEREMRAKQKEIDENYDLFKLRFRAMCTAPEASTLGLVLGADSFSQFLTRTQVSTRVAQYDRDMIDELTRQKNDLEAIKQGIETDKSDLLSDKQEIETKKQELSGQMAETQKQIQDIAAQEQQFLANKDAIQKQMKEVQATIDKIYAEINKNSNKIPYVGGTMGWPAPSLSQVTSGYGLRFGGGDNHTGIDISGPSAYGAAIVSANVGTVAFVNTAVTPGYGYGKYIIVDHGGGYTTLYGHCSAITAKVGDTVSRGEKIAEVGSTGWSTGPHVHFEVRVNGKHQNPVGYLSK